VLVRLFLGVLAAQVEHPQVPLRVANDDAVLLQHEGREIAVVVHDPLGPQQLAGTLVQLETFFVSVALDVLLELLLVVDEQAFLPMGAPPVGASGRLHLQNPQVQAQLDLIATVVPPDPPGHHVPRLVGPLVQDAADVQAHYDILDRLNPR